MEPTTTRKRRRVDESEDPDAYDDHPPRYRPSPFCQDCGARSHSGTCRPRCHHCDRKHLGACTAFCRKCAEIGHSWRRCRLFVPHHIWVKQRYGMCTSIQNVNITLPLLNPGPSVTTTSLNAVILSQFDVALSGFHRKAGIPMDLRVMVNNVNITTNILDSEKAPPIVPDRSLLDRVQRVPTALEHTQQQARSYKARLYSVILR
ncbi:hypothetical protein N7447_009407 [Penicillium robsamsonii]|uniref:uncharacterized protein n=1 Tax=Penicillium robsamsonii TaxID=1792511 RepID=UPI002548C36A|nr:uncharacterized protein N7447_009407 [Penicillium robsamsonii]KAJ5817174.1 hypothetical protein N7447_009407 [Penicillium robsamsonii]